MAERITLKVDGKAHAIETDPAKPLLYVLRDECGLKNPRFGCGLAQCGACTVQLDGKPTRSCVTPVAAVKDREITTIVGLGTPKNPHPLQKAYIDQQVPQCGMCTNAFLMTGAALLRDTPRPDPHQIRSALTGLKCRCGTHLSIIRAILQASGQNAEWEGHDA
jgi:aerobic-type carbon monoxide dehydrogenase small subunit (CoxS/CutS family)